MTVEELEDKADEWVEFTYDRLYYPDSNFLARIDARNAFVAGAKLMQKELKEQIQNLATVICNDIGIGVSAMSILAYCTGVENNRMYPPADGDDFKRCHNLLSAFPEWKKKLKDIGKIHNQWGTVGEHWNEIEEEYLKGNCKSVNQMIDKYRHEKCEK